MNRKERDEMSVYGEMIERLNSSLAFSGLRATEGAIASALWRMRRAHAQFTLVNFREQIISDFRDSSLWAINKLAEEMAVYDGDSLASIAICVVEKAIKAGIVSKED